MKVVKGERLTWLEANIWGRARQLVKQNSNTKWCDQFITMLTNKSAVCCIVRVFTQRFGFCLYEGTLEKRYTSRRGYRNPSIYYTYRTHEEIETVEVVIYVNLFAVPCYPPKDESVCTQYVS